MSISEKGTGRSEFMFIQVKSIRLSTLKLIHQVGGFSVSKDGDRIGQIFVLVEKQKKKV